MLTLCIFYYIQTQDSPNLFNRNLLGNKEEVTSEWHRRKKSNQIGENCKKNYQKRDKAEVYTVAQKQSEEWEDEVYKRKQANDNGEDLIYLENSLSEETENEEKLDFELVDDDQQILYLN